MKIRIDKALIISKNPRMTIPDLILKQRQQVAFNSSYEIK
jgi:hypothetical protein